MYFARFNVGTLVDQTSICVLRIYHTSSSKNQPARSKVNILRSGWVYKCVLQPAIGEVGVGCQAPVGGEARSKAVLAHSTVSVLESHTRVNEFPPLMELMLVPIRKDSCDN